MSPRHGHLAFALVLAFDPAFEHVDHLEFDIVIMPLGDFGGIAGRHHLDDVGASETAGRRGNAEIAVLRVTAQALLERARAVVTGDKSLLARRRFSFALGSCDTASRRCGRRPPACGFRRSACRPFAFPCLSRSRHDFSPLPDQNCSAPLWRMTTERASSGRCAPNWPNAARVSSIRMSMT